MASGGRCRREERRAGRRARLESRGGRSVAVRTLALRSAAVSKMVMDVDVASGVGGRCAQRQTGTGRAQRGHVRRLRGVEGGDGGGGRGEGDADGAGEVMMKTGLTVLRLLVGISSGVVVRRSATSLAGRWGR